ncbi:MAG: glycosyltransferase family 39 protein [Thiobacillaceae bacterium]|nr:glycosyltransferase family 39 protein [Thiobacillaceae bacterium]MCX7672583.1 glycosyltransferase family 39 protein [Thiobacillaceae bacterium]MDW8322523.1 glycosyltransferase family 39 protein [Burkholderiales bacterium]
MNGEVGMVGGRRDLWLLILLLGLLVAWRIAALLHLDLELYADEAQYWSWSLAPDFGYYSKPPMVAWLIALSTRLLGDGELAVRAATFVLWPATSVWLWLTVRRLFAGEPWAAPAALASALAFATLPMTFLGGILITTDAPLLFFWAASLYLLVRTLQGDRWRDWLGLGLLAGLGLLSKYSMVFFAPALLAYLLASPAQRRLLLTPKPYAAAAVALAVFAPNLVWNARHHYASLQHTAEISQLGRSLFHPEALLEFFAAQFLVFGPIMLLGLIALALQPRIWWMDARLRLLAAFAFVPLAAFLLLALLSRALANWAAFAYAAGSALVVTLWIVRRQGRWFKAALIVNLLLGALVYHLPDATRALGLELGRKTDPYARVTGYRALGAEVRRRLAAEPGARLMADDRKSMASLLYYARPESLDAVYYNPSGALDNHYVLTREVAQRPHGRFLLVTRGREPAQLARHFAVVERMPDIRIRTHHDHMLVYQVWRLHDYKGAHCIPSGQRPNQSSTRCVATASR